MAKGKDMMESSSGGKCSCNWGLTIVGAIVAVIALYLFGAGLNAQLNGAGIVWGALGWYLVSVVVMLVAKMVLWRGCGKCPVHGFG
ncbi:hypothetical protein HYV49_04425 [Candidatus Pacearchaeota archaeon]|nr:hypothetical protein [Candidatus Pacearchaeota archaeon]